MMKNILCYGDSNTWGYNPLNGERYAWQDRWPGVLSANLGSDYRIIEEGLNGRTTVFDDPIEPFKNGLHYLIPCLESQRPLDLVILMLGTNDFKLRFSASARDIGKGIRVLIDTIFASGSSPGGGVPQILLVCPAPFATLTEKAETFEGAEEKSQRLSGHYRQVAEEYGLAYLNAGEVIQSSPIDGFHLEISEHHKLGKAITIAVQKIFKDQ
jgi:lysophospholipase L1-like esterase